MAVTIAAICDGIANTLSATTGIASTKSYDEITEGIPGSECPRLQVYPDALEQGAGVATERMTFSAGVQPMRLTVFVDVFARVRSHIHLDLEAMVATLDNIIDTLQEQERPPFFNVPGIKSFTWSWRRATLRYGDNRYLGGRFTLIINFF